ASLHLSSNVDQIGGTTVLTGGTNGSLGIGGLAASGATASGNPVPAGLTFNTTQPTVTNGQAVQAQGTARGAVIVATGTDALNATQTGTWTVQPGNTANTTAWLVKATDGTSNNTFKASGTNAATTDTALVVAPSPNPSTVCTSKLAINQTA